ncbi:substrate-binding periplasmic protein [Bowmanella pacifica]|uniref:Amino acid ABC transporter substrate-binding protein n=1 Tax=Bowmanella pacifica TaxID=502051 RepID=A0A918DKB3_9ALTE|nr:transporter substrate-binding domain-containing protein [Bowmanella pacifica]GGO70637.1 amino acid ABC transporter substrate-binding protein [Bowmanella pacifica]
MRLFLLGWLLFAAQSSYAQTTVILAAESSWPPYAKADGQGISRDIIEKAYALTGTKVTFVIVPYARALHLTKQGDVDGAFNVTRQESTERDFLFGDEPLLQATASFYFPPNSSLNFESILNAPNRMTVAIIIGYEYGDLYDKQRYRFSEVAVSSQNQIIKLLRRDRVQSAIMFDRVAEYHLQQLKLPLSSIRKGPINHISDIHVAFSRERPSAKAAMSKLDEGLRLLRLSQPIEPSR